MSPKPTSPTPLSRRVPCSICARCDRISRICVETRTDGSLRRFEYEIDGDRMLRVQREDAALVAALVPIAKTRRIEVIHGHIGLTRRRCSRRWMPPASRSISRWRSPRCSAATSTSTATYSLAISSRCSWKSSTGTTGDTAFAGYGPILAAEFDNDGHRVRAVRFTPPGGTPG